MDTLSILALHLYKLNNQTSLPDWTHLQYLSLAIFPVIRRKKNLREK